MTYAADDGIGFHGGRSVFALARGIEGFTQAPEFEVWDSVAESVRTSNGTEDFDVFFLADQAGSGAVLDHAKSIVAESYAGVAYQNATREDPNQWGVERRSVGWNGTYTETGKAFGGTIE